MKSFISLELARNYSIPGVRFPFIVSQECHEIYIDQDGKEQVRSRQFLCFPSVEEYFMQIDIYDNCHELVIPHGNNKFITTQGRLVFDFDLHISFLPESFYKDVEEVILLTFRLHYSIDIGRLEFVWLDCENEKKISKHLIVKNAWFIDDWVQQTKEFYILFSHEVEKSTKFSWFLKNHTVKDLVDFQLARHSASLRMPYNSKIGGKPLLFRQSRPFYDGLIGVYRNEDKKKEQVVKTSHLKSQVVDYVKVVEKHDFSQMEEEVAEKAFTLFSQHANRDGTFIIGKIFGSFVNLTRTKPSKCLLNLNHSHESDNSYLFVTPDTSVYYFCRRGCCNKRGQKCLRIGQIVEKEIPASLKNVKIPEWI